MNFTAGILIITLFLDTTIRTNISEEEYLPIERFEMWDEGLPDQRTLYLLSRDQLMQDPGIWQNRIVLFSGHVDDTEELSHVHWISVSGRISVKQLADMAQRAMLRFYRFAARLQSQLSARKPVEQLLTMLEKEYGISSCISTRSMRITALSEHFRERNTWVDDKNEVLFKTVSDLEMDPDFQTAFQYEEAFPYQNEELEWYYCYNLKKDEDYRQRLICSTGDHRRHHGVKELVDVLGQGLGEIYEDYMYFEESAQDLQDFNVMLESMLRGEMPAPGEMRRRLQFRRWEENQEYQVILFKFREDAGKGMGMAYHRPQIRKLFGDCYVLEETSPFVCIRNLTRTQGSRNSYQEQLPYFLRETLCRAGFSNTFTGFTGLYSHLIEAEQALLIGERTDPTQWCYYFADCQLAYMLEQCTRRLPADQLCHPALLILRKYDEENNTHLTETLNVYLTERHSLVHTAEKLLVHRTTLLARLDRIRILTGANLEDHDTCLHLMLSFALFRNESSKK